MHLPPKWVRFQVCEIKVMNLYFLHKTELEGDPETFIFGFLKLFDLTQPESPAGLSKSYKSGVFQIRLI